MAGTPPGVGLAVLGLGLELAPPIRDAVQWMEERGGKGGGVKVMVVVVVVVVVVGVLLLPLLLLLLPLLPPLLLLLPDADRAIPPKKLKGGSEKADRFPAKKTLGGGSGMAPLVVLLLLW